MNEIKKLFDEPAFNVVELGEDVIVTSGPTPTPEVVESEKEQQSLPEFNVNG